MKISLIHRYEYNKVVGGFYFYVGINYIVGTKCHHYVSNPMCPINIIILR